MIDDLNIQYNSLSENEKNTLLIYKSRLGLLINDLDNNPDYNYYYDYLINIFNNPINMLLKTTIFKSIDLTSIDAFKESIINIKNNLDELINKFIINEDITLYRIISSNDYINGISKGNIISTSFSFGETLKFANAGENIVIYQINLKKGSHVGYIPYSILYDNKNNRLVLSKNQNEEEIIIDKNNYNFDEVNNYMQNGINFITIDGNEKNNIKGR